LSASRAGFELGEQEVSEGVGAVIKNIGVAPVMQCLSRHLVGDWGEVGDEDRHLNNLSFEDNGRYGFKSSYTVKNGTVLWVLTFEDCSGTLVLTDEEYNATLPWMDEEPILTV
jgi:hypothetical protein